MGLSCNLEVLCTVCDWKSNIFYSKKIPNFKAYDINLCSIIAFRENGKGYTGLESLCSLFDIAPPMNKNANQKLLFCDKNSYKETAKLSMKTAADEVRNLVISEENDTVNEDERATNKNANIDVDDSHSDENSIITDDEFIADTVVSSDGLWQKRG